jgi:hypothetical protein
MLGSGVLGFADWLFPETIAILVAVPATDFSLAVVVAVPEVMVTVRDAAVVGSVYVVVASPFEAVIAGFGENVPPMPSVKLMGAPTTSPPDEFLASTTRGKGNVVPTVAVCFPPEIRPRAETATEVVPVSVKVAAV